MHVKGDASQGSLMLAGEAVGARSEDGPAELESERYERGLELVNGVGGLLDQASRQRIDGLEGGQPVQRPDWTSSRASRWRRW